MNNQQTQTVMKEAETQGAKAEKPVTLQHPAKMEAPKPPLPSP